jgi:hypothetical protein
MYKDVLTQFIKTAAPMSGGSPSDRMVQHVMQPLSKAALDRIARRMEKTAALNPMPLLRGIASAAPSIFGAGRVGSALSAMSAHPIRTVLGAAALGGGGMVANQHLENAARYTPSSGWSLNPHRWGNPTTDEQAFTRNAEQYGGMRTEQSRRIGNAILGGNLEETDRLQTQLNTGNHGGANSILPWNRDSGWHMPSLGGLNPWASPNAEHFRGAATTLGDTVDSRMARIRENMRDPRVTANLRTSMAANLNAVEQRMRATRTSAGLPLPNATSGGTQGGPDAHWAQLFGPHNQGVLRGWQLGERDYRSDPWEAIMREHENSQRPNVAGPLTRSIV